MTHPEGGCEEIPIAIFSLCPVALSLPLLSVSLSYSLSPSLTLCLPLLLSLFLLSLYPDLDCTGHRLSR